jgi:hypothetical protein
MGFYRFVPELVEKMQIEPAASVAGCSKVFGFQRLQIDLGRSSDGEGLYGASHECAAYWESARGDRRDSAIFASIALQHGAHIETLRHALTRDRSATSAIGAALDELCKE